MAIPVIDFSMLNGSERTQTLAQIANGCEEWGFFELVNHGIPVELLDRVKKVCSECYKMEREEGFKAASEKLLKKMENSGKEDVDWEDVFLLQDDNEWPSNPRDFKETMKAYRAEIKNLAERVMEVMDENLGLDKGYINRAFCGGDTVQQPFFGTKVSHYPPCPRPDLVNGLRAHTDAGGVILLFQDDEVAGLQILKDGRWIDVQPLPNSIVINTGDQIEVLSNGQYKSVRHRVLPTPDGNRRSIASFYNPAMKATIGPATKLVAQAAAVASYPDFVFGDYMDVYAKQKFLAKEPRFQAVRAM
uniref:1-aminocyclopropane-1-carboxylate oxidase n=1 Tax=Tulipa gesneriana TaxID=13306 RepID=Q75QN1_TULGE|nr:1-aminocyclopropane-1-carboxylic acid oxidase [Tulipa gesneriana]